MRLTDRLVVNAWDAEQVGLGIWYNAPLRNLSGIENGYNQRHWLPRRRPYYRFFHSSGYPRNQDRRYACNLARHVCYVQLRRSALVCLRYLVASMANHIGQRHYAQPGERRTVAQDEGKMRLNSRL